MKIESCKTPRRFFARSISRLVGATALALALASGCAAPASVEGIFSQVPFEFDDPKPAIRVDNRGDQIYLVISEETATTLTVAQLRLPTTDLRPGDSFAFGEDDRSDVDAHLHMARGQVEVTYLSDGTRIVNARNSTMADAAEGTVTIDAADDYLAGSFRGTLEDGGEVTGRFAIEMPQ